jgi:hypothetical protein
MAAFEIPAKAEAIDEKPSRRRTKPLRYHHCQCMRSHYISQPHPHLGIDEIVAAEAYAALRFPDELTAAGAAWGITASDAQYDVVLRDPGWRTLHDELCSEAFVRSVLRSFSADMKREGCLVDAESARIVPFLETREDKERPTLDPDAPPNDVFIRVDFQSKGAGGYRDFVHLDWARRIVGGILFFSDTEEEGLEGGELAFYRDRDFRNDRWCHDPELAALVPPKRNSGVIFLNHNGAFHGPRPITRLAGRRRWLYYSISSRADVWPHAARADEASSDR